MVSLEGKEENHEENGSVKLPEEELLLQDKPEDVMEIPNGKPPSEIGNGDLNTKIEDKLPLPPLIRTMSEIALSLQGSEETTCGIWCIKGKLLQRFANKKAYVLLYGMLGFMLSMSYAYLNGIITTLEKRFKIPTTNTGIIMIGSDFTQLVLCVFLNYYASRGHRPRWIAFGVYTVVIFCLMNALPQFLYGPGEDALALTEEFGGQFDGNTTALLIDSQNRKLLCQEESGKCVDNSGSFAPQVILFCAQLISGIGGSLYYTLGVSYMDDNIKKSKTPALVSLSYFLRMLGPATGYGLASLCLSLYISPTLTPTITTKDPRWLGAWWMGWLFIAVMLFVSASLLALFPKTLPRAAARKVLASERRKAGIVYDTKDENLDELPTSFKDMMKTLKRLLLNKTLMYNNFAGVFYIMGYMPYWIFMPKYIETIYKQTASFAAFITGFLGLVFSAIGILFAGMFISKVKPSARFLAAWNVVVGVISVLGVLSYSFLGCPVNDRQGVILESGQMNLTTPCNEDCHCDYVKYSPVCSPDGRTFISPCHAGCRDYRIENGSKVYVDCACVPRPVQALALQSANHSTEIPSDYRLEDPWVTTEGPCPIDCSSNFLMFLVILCTLKFSGATGRTSNFLVSVRCVEEKDKTVSLGLGVMFMTLFAFIPSPITFGYLIDTTCLVWGKTCSGTGNCWLYNAEMLLTIMNLVAAGFIAIGTVCDIGVWYYVKDLKIFDEKVELEVSPQRMKTQKK